MNKCSRCDKDVSGHYVSPEANVKVCLDCWSGKKTLTWWVAVTMVQFFVLASIFCLVKMIFS